jgi:homoprotocatechuate degradation regulator HpaR
MDARISKPGAPRRPPMPFPQTLPAVLMRAREAVMGRVRPTLKAYEVTEPQWRVLRTLSALDEIEVTQLAELVFLLPSSLSRILRDLGERGLIQRRTSDADLRRGLVSISEKGMDLIQAALPHVARTNDEIEEAYGAARLAQLRRLLSELEQALGGAQPEED